MFYEKLAEAKREKKKLSVPQVLGVGAAGLAGGVGGIGLAHEALMPHFDKKRMALLGDHFRARSDAYRTGMTGRKLKAKLDAIDLAFNEGFDHIGNVHDRYKIGGGLLLGGGLAYGAKKFMDRRNQRKG